MAMHALTSLRDGLSKDRWSGCASIEAELCVWIEAVKLSSGSRAKWAWSYETTFR